MTRVRLHDDVRAVARPTSSSHDIRRPSEAGFDFSVISDHYQPWLASQGHSPYAWSVLGAAAQATERIGLMTYVTCPDPPLPPGDRRAEGGDDADPLRATASGSGSARARTSTSTSSAGAGLRSVSATRCSARRSTSSRRCSTATGRSTIRGKHFDVESAQLWDLPDERVPIGIAVSGPDSCRLAGEKADLMIAVEPKRELGEMFDAAGGQRQAAGRADRGGLRRRP